MSTPTNEAPTDLLSILSGPYDARQAERARASVAELIDALDGALTVLQMTAECRDGRLADYVETRHGSLLKVVDVIAEARAALAKATGAAA